VEEIDLRTRSRRFLDVEFLKLDMADAKSKVARKMAHSERDGVLAERINLLKHCIAAPGAPSSAKFLYVPKEAVSMTGGSVERQRAARG
jgi:hypothetical protein